MKDDTIYLEHIENSLKRIVHYVSNVSKEAFLEDIQKQDACIRQIEIMGEATKRISDAFKEKYPEIPWKDMAGMRDKLIHDYLDVDLNIVFQTVAIDVPMLLPRIEKILG
ncbi:MAG: DUF86 domain-containing protein [Bacteroidales bacterium]|jgi:uncharacterized protein with HEPN domain|nr:DUF86 domain-containing protein [Bacteroidales bacterium]